MLETRAERGAVRLWRPACPVDVPATLGPMRRGTGDPAYHVDEHGSVWRALRTPDGVATLRLVTDVRAGSVAATAWGPGAGWALETLPALLGAHDRPDGFRPALPLLRDTWRRYAGWRVPRSQLVFEALVPAVLEQKVTGTEAWRGWRYLLRRYGERPPGPPDLLPPNLRVMPGPEVWRCIPSWEWHRGGVDHSRASTVIRAASVAGRLEQAVQMDHGAARARLCSLPGVGAWTAAEVAQRALGDADAVSVGDFHLPSLVGWALAGRRVDDDGMLELLEPYRGHRFRVTRLIELSGVRPPRRGPRFAPHDHRAR